MHWAEPTLTAGTTHAPRAVAYQPVGLQRRPLRTSFTPNVSTTVSIVLQTSSALLLILAATVSAPSTHHYDTPSMSARPRLHTTTSFRTIVPPGNGSSSTRSNRDGTANSKNGATQQQPSRQGEQLP